MEENMQYSYRKCPCGHPACSDYHLTGIGAFVQGSGFTLEEASTIVNALNLATLRTDAHEVLDLRELLDTQMDLQHKMGNPISGGEAGVKENLLHVIVETVEAMREINFKPWSTNVKQVDHEALATELTDILQFWANAAICIGFTPKDLTDALRTKWQVNRQRIKDKEVTSLEGLPRENI